MTVVAFIPARAGSERIPDKNLQEVGDFSLVVHVCDQAQIAGVDRVVLSTDELRIYQHVTSHQWHHMRCADEWHERPANLAGPNAQIEDAVLHWARRASIADEDIICILQPTSPFRRPESIRACVEAVQSGKAETALTVTRFARLPFLGRKITDDGRSLWERPRGWKRPRSQDVRHVPQESGSVYAFTWGHLKRTGQRMEERPAVVEVDWLEALEIDTPADLELARILAPHVDRLRGMDG